MSSADPPEPVPADPRPLAFRPQRRSVRARAKAAARRSNELIATTASRTDASQPGGIEWVLDNHFVLRRATRQVRRGLTIAFERRLPVLGPTSAHPGLRRIEVEAFAILRESEGLIDRELLARRIAGFGREHDVSLAELWALPLLLRLGLLEQLVVDLPALLHPSVDTENDHRVANCVRSLLTLERIDWARFIERVSEVEQILTGDPSGVYSKMDFATRNRYRGAVELLARRSELSETQVAHRAIELATLAIDRPGELRRHVGDYLLGEGRHEFERVIGHATSLATRARRRVRAHAAWIYIVSLILVAALHVAGLAGLLTMIGLAPTRIVIVCVLALVPAWTIAVSLIHWLVALTVRPLPLAKLEFLDGVPAEHRTLIVVPGLLTGPADVDALADQLEAHYLATRDPRIDVAMLTDLRDAPHETLADDDALVERARARIVTLNLRYGGSRTEGRFHLFHRKRVWCDRQGLWMGWERKRGKLDELNRLLRGDTETTYVVHEGDPDQLESFRYVLTLDADTLLPLGAGRRLIETLAHPLNAARFDDEDRVRSGYTVLQPRIEITPLDSPSRFAHVFAGDGAFDIYTHAVSDVYQDLFGEGAFVGKGIYAIDDFQRSVAGRIPDDRVLSHDLLEGLLGRAGLASDVILYEDYPSNWLAYTRRLHRWIRGDWQLLTWLRRRSRLGALARYRILDNLRRSALAPSLIVFAMFAWLVLPADAWLWTGLVVVLLATPALTELAGVMLRGMHPGELRPAIADVFLALPSLAARGALRTSLMVHEALVSLDAMIRAIVRTSITHRNQLEWTPTAVAGLGTADARAVVRAMAPASGVTIGLAGLLALLRPSSLAGAAPLLIAWMLAPALAVSTARPRRRPQLDSVEIDRVPLRRLARRTWAYFETVVGPGDHWLPPDNLQELPRLEVAHRTSPTNIAMALLTTLAAHDLGYVDLLELVFRLRSTFETLARVPRHRGHVLNWISTTTLEPLEPRYVSTVDSGNLAGALIVLEQACRELARTARPVHGRFAGLADSFEVLAHALAQWDVRAEPAARQVAAMRAHVLRAVDDRSAWSTSLAALDDDAFATLDAHLLALFQARTGDESEPAGFEDLQTWATRLRAEVAGLRSELAAQLAWLDPITTLPAPIPSDLHDAITTLQQALGEVPRLGEIGERLGRAIELVEHLRSDHALTPAWLAWADRLEDTLHTSRNQALMVQTRLDELAQLAAAQLAAMDFAFLYDHERELAYIGYDVSAERYDDHHYDLLASEARLASLIAIAKGDMPLRHWTKLGRPIGRFGADRGLLSWSGTMFEYLMPPLLLDEGKATLLDVSARAAIRAQIDYARGLGLPWGMSESGYARLDNHHHYQYRAFGVPAIGFRRGLERDRVIAPYASVLALGYEPAAVVDNLAAIASAGGFGPLGVYEALDYTRERVGLDRDHEVVRSYMSHHQGMVMLGLHGYLCERCMVQRMHANPAIRGVELLLHERSPGRVPVERPQPAEDGPPIRERLRRAEGWTARAHAGVDAHAISNGRYGLLITRAGAGHSWWKKVAITRPCLDGTLEDVGTVLYVRDDDDGRTWCSLGEHPPTRPDPPTREVVFTPHGATFTTHMHELVAELTITIAPREDAELRVLRLQERGGRARRLTLTSYAELVLGNPVEYERHPAFAKLFIDSQVLVFPRPLILCRRRPRSPEQPEPWLACMLISDTVIWSAYATERERFVGRHRSLVDPAGLTRWMPIADTPMQATLDTCVVMAGDVVLAAGGACECAFVSVFGSSRTEVIERAGRLATMAAIRRNLLDAERVAIERARARRHDTDALRGHQRLLSAVLYPRPELRAAPEILTRNKLGQPALWRHGISGDLPIVLARVTTVGAGIVLRLADAHTYWHERGVLVDLVVLEDRSSSYDGSLRHRLAQLLEHAGARMSASDGGVFVVHGASLSAAERTVLLSCANLVIEPEQDLDRLLAQVHVPLLPRFEPEGRPRASSSSSSPSSPLSPMVPLTRPTALRFDNGYGGFSPDGREYVIHLEPDRPTPAPWVNVIANPQFGCVVSEQGIAYAWSLNAGLHRLTPWSNDPVLDPPSISVYLRDELDGEIWSPIGGPARDPAPYQVRHGAGYTRFDHRGHGIDQTTLVFVAPHEPVALIQLVLVNPGDRPRRLTITLCVEWLLGARRSDARTLVTDFVPEHEVVLTSNPWNPTFAERFAFVTTSERLHGITTSREEFFGRNGDRRRPSALRRIGLSGEIVHGSDPCTALQVHVVVPAGASRVLHFALGETEDRASALALAERYQDRGHVDAARERLDHVWDDLLSAVEVESPDPGFDLMVNRWLLYATVAARLWGRTGFQQSSGAFGFRDQLQDVMAVIHAHPELARAHLLDAASRQFVEGDVLHWWHPPKGEGLRSRCSDDLLWLPFATAHYVHASADESILHESVRFLDAAPLAVHEHERYCAELDSRGAGTLYEHCLRAFAHASGTGPHGLPLIGSCDWNDGFSHVGLAGRGESVWLGWFIQVGALAFADVCDRLGRSADAAMLRERAAALTEPLASAWDGAWYVRAYHDDGSPIGAEINDACRIDSIAQSWAVLAGPLDHATQAMQSAWRQLVMPEERLVRLFVPPFIGAQARVGYVEGYPPGVRENGGQYTHAAVWVGWAFAELGDIDRAWTIATMISPLAHGSDPEAIERYRVEPYVLAADIYTEPPHIGRGGWTWYTGAAGWSHRLAVEQLLGVRRIEGRITLAPTLPGGWPGYRLRLRDADSVYRVEVGKRSAGVGRRVVEFTLDGVVQPLPATLPAPDGREHEVVITLDAG